MRRRVLPAELDVPRWAVQTKLYIYDYGVAWDTAAQKYQYQQGVS